MDLLMMLVERRGQLVHRDEIVDRLWGKDVFVDVDTGVHTAVRKIRRALGDSTDELTSMLGLQQELGAGIAEQIRFRLTPQRFEALARREPRVAAAYDEYLRGVTFARQRTPATMKQAIEHYERATTRRKS